MSDRPDETLGAALRALPMPGHEPGFWADLDARLVGTAVDHATAPYEDQYPVVDLEVRPARAARRAMPVTRIAAGVLVIAAVAAGLVLLTNRDGHKRLLQAARPVSSPTPATDGPAAFVGVEGGRLARYDAHRGSRQAFLTEPNPGGGDSEPVLVGDTVWFVRGAGACLSGIWKVPIRGGNAVEVLPAGDGAASNLAVSADGSRLAWVHQPCSGPPVLRIRNVATGQERAFAVGNPPTIVGRPSWAPDDRHLAFFYRGGGGVAYGVSVLDTTTGSTAAEARPLETNGCYQANPAYLPDGALVVVTCADPAHATKLAAIRFDAASGRRLGTVFNVEGTFSEPAAENVQSLAFSPDGQHALFEMITRGVHPIVLRWDGGRPVPVSTDGRAPTW